VEFAAELFDLCHEDLKKLYPNLVPLVKISLYDVAPKILPMFDTKLSNYAIELFKRDGIDVKTQHNILELRRGLPGAGPTDRDAGCFTLRTKQNGEMGIGMCVWSTGLSLPDPYPLFPANPIRSHDEPFRQGGTERRENLPNRLRRA
jgi:NADH dehydrogenase FAD-containing subunit